MSTTSEKLDRIIELLEEGIPAPGPCGAEFVTTITWPGREPREHINRCNLTANHAGLHTDGEGSQWARIAEKVEPAPYRPADATPDVDLDERQSHPGVLWDKIDALTADVERLTRERDEQRDLYEGLEVDVERLHGQVSRHHEDITRSGGWGSHQDCSAQQLGRVERIIQRNQDRKDRHHE